MTQLAFQYLYERAPPVKANGFTFLSANFFMDSDSDCEATFFDDVKNVDWFFLNSGKSKGNSNALWVCFLMPA